jgi:hypothetical protein
MFESRQYVIFSVEELSKINFTEVLETSADTVRKSIDGTKTFVKWENDVPSCIETLETKSSYYTHEEIIVILSGEEWTSVLHHPTE